MDVMLIHGLSGSSADMGYLAGRMERNGYRTLNVSLPGHGTKPADLLSVDMQDWIDAVASEISACPDGVFVVGQSMGALLALDCAVRYSGKVKGMVLLAPAIKLRGVFTRVFMHALCAYACVLPLPRLYYVKKTGPDIADPEVKKNYSAYDKIPFHALVEFERLRKRTIGRLSRVTCPLLIIYSVHDHTIAGDAAEIIDSRTGSTIKETETLEQSFHVLSMDRDKETISGKVIGFLKNNERLK